MSAPGPRLLLSGLQDMMLRIDLFQSSGPQAAEGHNRQKVKNCHFLIDFSTDPDPAGKPGKSGKTVFFSFVALFLVHVLVQ
eukprot:SAG11_NODE_15366_length_580_cov_1.507277_1_plen_81_part_00